MAIRPFCHPSFPGTRFAAFMMPVGTPPNAMVFGTGRLKIGDMLRAGFWLNVVSIIVISIAVLIIDPGIIPVT